VKALKRLQAETAAKLDALLPAILDRAFAGKLVPQNPEDEPAEKLLERIRKEKP
jgi:type I restriction enzyme S subunit